MCLGPKINTSAQWMDQIMWKPWKLELKVLIKIPLSNSSYYVEAVTTVSGIYNNSSKKSFTDNNFLFSNRSCFFKKWKGHLILPIAAEEPFFRLSILSVSSFIQSDLNQQHLAESKLRWHNRHNCLIQILSKGNMKFNQLKRSWVASLTWHKKIAVIKAIWLQELN